MDHRQLRFLTALARERHFGHAAKACHVTQPTLSARLKQLEEELGTSLIVRGRRFEGFTPEGERVLTHARRILAEFDELKSELDPALGPSGWLRIGIIPAALGEVTGWVPRLRERFPSLHIQLREYSTLALMQALMDGELDLAVGYLDVPAAEPFAARPLYRERYSALSSALHFELPAGLDWAMLKGYPLCLLTPEMQQRHRIDVLLERAGVSADAVIEADSMAVLAALIAQGCGVGIVPSTFEQTMLLDDLMVRCLPAHDAGAPVGLLWRAGGPVSRRLRATLDWLDEHR
ncbi:LysR family transcriptional regulator [Phytohalomonas tamaricis]|uniref:LysR family transcriptional regulator n=1 Tax=Phytohalomonas tamaricis TaxID=2081032 RepID=UPI000D0B667C|nr:LysR family transcriptional regulator [Phytohalomonas tamaricis]